MPVSRTCRLVIATLLLGVAVIPETRAQFSTPTVGGRYQNESGFYSQQMVTIPVRAASHKDFSRIVFEWPERVSYTVDSPAKGVLDVKFKRKALVNMSDVRAAPETNFGKVDVLSGLHKNLVIRLLIPTNATYKSYSIGYKVVIDVDDVPGQKRGENIPREGPASHDIAAPDSEPESIATPEAAVQPKEAKTGTPVVKTPVPVVPEPAEPMTKLAPQPPQTMMFGWTATKAFSVSAFLHNNALYFVTDSDNLDFAPKVKIGSIEDGAIKRIPSEKGLIYRIDLPPYALGDTPVLSSDGGGLAWGFTINPAVPPRANPTVMKPETEGSHTRFVVPMSSASDTLAFTDPDTGEEIIAILVDDHTGALPHNYRTPDMEILGGSAGFAVRPLNDLLDISIKSGKVVIDTPSGLIASRDAQTQAPAVPQQAAGSNDQTPRAPSLLRRIFYFDRWLVGLPDDYSEARQMLETRLYKAPAPQKPEVMITLGKFQLAHGFAPEALGYFSLASLMVPAMEQDPEFRALRGASLALIGDGEGGLRDLSDMALDDIPEIGIWRAYAAAQSYNWADSFTYMPSDLTVLSYYPARVKETLTLTLAETFLRVNRPNQAEALLVMLQKSKTPASPHREAATHYLLGEIKRLQKKSVEAIELWNKAEESNDQLYRVKATLAKTALQLQERAVKPEEAIERLERLRFAWRGDGLETQIAQVLGRLYLTSKKWQSAFELMRDAAGFAEGSQEGQAITASMTQAFAQLYTNPPPELKAADAIALYDRFPELTPAGEEGKAVRRGLAQFLLQMDLLERAGDVYEKLIPESTNGVETLNDGLQLAAVRLLAREPQEALAVLSEGPVATAKGTDQQARQRMLLRARALSDLKKTDDAMAVLAALSVADDSLSLIADTAWRAARWDVAAQSLAVMINRQDLASAAQLDQKEMDLVINRAVALRLANNETELAALRAAYLSRITDDNKKRQFNAITRPAQNVTLADRETLLGIANEVDLFSSFLNDTATTPQEAAKPAVAPAPAQPPAPGTGTAPSP